MQNKNAKNNKAEKAIAAVVANNKLNMQAAASAPVTQAATAKRISHLQLGPALLAQKASEAEILAAFTKSFTSRGVTSAEFIAKRATIYMHIARKAAAKAAKATAQTTAKAS